MGIAVVYLFSALIILPLMALIIGICSRNKEEPMTTTTTVTDDDKVITINLPMQVQVSRRDRHRSNIGSPHDKKSKVSCNAFDKANPSRKHGTGSYASALGAGKSAASIVSKDNGSSASGVSSNNSELGSNTKNKGSRWNSKVSSTIVSSAISDMDQGIETIIIIFIIKLILKFIYFQYLQVIRRQTQRIFVLN